MQKVEKQKRKDKMNFYKIDYKIGNNWKTKNSYFDSIYKSISFTHCPQMFY